MCSDTDQLITSACNFHAREIVDRGSETQLQVRENYMLMSYNIMECITVQWNTTQYNKMQ